MTKSPRRVPGSPRAQKTVDILLEAVTRLSAGQPPATIDVNEVARIAGVSVGTIYHYFPTKAALLAAWEEAQMSTMVNDLIVAYQTLDAQALPCPVAVRTCAEVAFDILQPLAYSYAASEREDYLGRLTKTRAVIDAVSCGIADVIRRRGVTLPESELQTKATVAVAGFVYAVLWGTALRPDAVEDGSLRREVCDLIAAYLVPIAQGRHHAA